MWNNSYVNIESSILVWKEWSKDAIAGEYESLLYSWTYGYVSDILWLLYTWRVVLSFSLPSSFSCSDVIVLSLYVVDWKFNLLRGEGGVNPGQASCFSFSQMFVMLVRSPHISIWLANWYGVFHVGFCVTDADLMSYIPKLTELQSCDNLQQLMSNPTAQFLMQAGYEHLQSISKTQAAVSWLD